MIKDAEARGVLVRGEPGIVVEGTAGNTGIGLALAARTFGYETVICLADTQSQEKKDQLRWAGANLVEVPAVPYRNENNYVHVAARLAAALGNASKNDEFCIKNVKLCIKNEKLCIKNEDFSIIIDEFCRS